MSTPSTATATLPPQQPPHYGYFRNGKYILVPTRHRRNLDKAEKARRLVEAQNPPSGGAPSGHNQIIHQQTSSAVDSTTEPSPYIHTPSHNHLDTADKASGTPAQYTGSEMVSKKRQRSKETDWNDFYRNGIPKEVIVIDDSPPPGARASDSVETIDPPVGASNGRNGPTKHVAKKRKHDDTGSAYGKLNGQQTIYTNGDGTNYHHTSTGSTVSTDRTTSAIHTTAATSLGSQYSLNGATNGYEAVEDTQTGRKRKRTTRQQIANEAKRRELEVHGDAFTNYKPPPHPPVKAGEVHVKVLLDNSYTKNSKVDDDDGHYIVVPDSDLTERYQVNRLLGQGTFGKVVQARDRKRGNLVAIKIIRSVQKYRDASKIELRVLSTLKANDAENRNRCIHLRDCFDYRGHICIVMDLLGQSVFDFLKNNHFVPFPNSQIQNFARQLFTSVAFLHDLNLIHTDLKPENILLCDSTYQTFTYNRRIPSSSSTVNRSADQRKVLLDTEIRLIDFGSATFQDEYHSSVVSTRHYRAPEIILGLGWSFPCDIWSIGCILVEFYTGDALFQTHDNLEHLAMMESVCGGRMDSHLVQQVNKMASRSSGNAASKYFKRLKLDYPAPDTTRASRRFVKAMKQLQEIIPSNTNFNRSFLDLLRKIFVYDQADRITAKQALQHPWFREVATPDDGTEAIKIRQERALNSQASLRDANPGRGNGYGR